MEANEEKFYPVNVVSRKLCCSVDAVYDLLARGRLKGIKIGQRQGIRVRGSSLKDFIQQAQRDFEAEF
jgi:hypothetical protein